MKEIFKCIVGSHLYGTNIETSDLDLKSVFVLPIDDYLKLSYPKQLDSNKDYCMYEVGRFLELLITGNPNMIDLLFIPDQFILNKDPLYDLILEHKDKFITKKCKNSFVGYAIGQIKKARALDKKLNWEKDRIELKDVGDFCFVITPLGTVPFKEWVVRQRGDMARDNHYCLSKLNNARDTYNLFYNPEHTGGFYGEESNEVRTESIPKELKPIGNLIWNKDQYSIHCKDYQEYQVWLVNRNTDRYKESSVKNQYIDAKNLMHCRRLLDMAFDIAKEGKVIVHRENKEELLKIRKGECNLQEEIERAENDVKILDELFDKSSLPESVDARFVDELLIKIRKS